MINIAIYLYHTSAWIGGLNYKKNLFTTIYQLENRKIEPYLITGTQIEAKLLDNFPKPLNIIQTKYLDENCLQERLSKGLYNRTGSMFFLAKVLKKNKIDVLSYHSMAEKNQCFKNLIWIPDFQWMYYPEFFTKEKLDNLKLNFEKQVKRSNILLFSSNSALEDAKKFFPYTPNYIDKFRVLHFASQPSNNICSTDKSIEYLEEKYKFRGKYFFLPNQFWKHKNHITVFKAIAKLKKQKLNVQLICTGSMHDDRNPDFFTELMTFVKTNDITDNIKFLGVIDYSDVLLFIRNSISVLNPSLFEGWSSTVEECKMIGKNMILSNLPVHIEQNPLNSIYFNPNDFNKLAQIIENQWIEGKSEPDFLLEKEAISNNRIRLKQFGESFQNIITDLF